MFVVAEAEWKITKRGTDCCACRAVLTGEQPYFSVLLQKPEGLARLDYCAGCFEAKRPQEVYYFWKAARPVDGENNARKRVAPVDTEYVLEFFKRLEGEAEAQKIAFRFILALMLARKKVLIFEEKKKDSEGREVQVFREKRGGLAHLVYEPVVSEAEIMALSAELGQLLGLPPPTPAAVAQPPSVGSTGGSACATVAGNQAAINGASENGGTVQ